MSKYLIVLLIFIFSACKKDFALFQASKSKNYSIPNVTNEFDNNIESFVEPPLPEFSASTEINFPLHSDYRLLEVQSTKTEPISNKISEKQGKIISKSNILIPKKEIETQKKRKKLYPAFNDNLKIGFVFLVIAAILGILNLSQLMLIFALASLIFLYLGLKKYFRRKRIKSWFKK